MQPQRLLERGLELRDLPQRLEGHLDAVGVEVVELAAVTDAITSGWRSSSIIVQAAVPELVWCPANIIEMNMPVISSAEKCGCRRRP